MRYSVKSNNGLKYILGAIFLFVCFIFVGCEKEQLEQNELGNSTVFENDSSELQSVDMESINETELHLMTEDELQEKYEEMLLNTDVGIHTIDLEAAYSTLEESSENCYFYRRDNRVESFIAYNEWELGITRDLDSGKRLELTDIVKDSETFMEVVKQYLIADVERNATQYSYVDTYAEKIISMEDNPDIWYWYMDASGIYIVFREYTLAAGKRTAYLPYSEWKDYLKDEYFINSEGLIAKISLEHPIRLEEDKYIEINDNTIIIKEMQLDFSKVYGQCDDAYIISGSNEEYYVLISTFGPTGVDDGSVLLYCISEGNIKECDSIQFGEIEDVESIELLEIGCYIEDIGTMYASGIYKINEDEKKILLADDWYKLNSLITVDGAELPVVLEGEEMLLPIGTTIRLIKTNVNGTVCFEIEATGENGEFYYNIDSQGRKVINGTVIGTYFEHQLSQYTGPGR